MPGSDRAQVGLLDKSTQRSMGSYFRLSTAFPQWTQRQHCRWLLVSSFRPVTCMRPLGYRDNGPLILTRRIYVAQLSLQDLATPRGVSLRGARTPRGISLGFGSIRKAKRMRVSLRILSDPRRVRKGPRCAGRVGSREFAPANHEVRPGLRCPKVRERTFRERVGRASTPGQVRAFPLRRPMLLDPQKIFASNPDGSDEPGQRDADPRRSFSLPGPPSWERSYSGQPESAEPKFSTEIWVPMST